MSNNNQNTTDKNKTNNSDYMNYSKKEKVKTKPPKKDKSKPDS